MAQVNYYHDNSNLVVECLTVDELLKDLNLSRPEETRVSSLAKQVQDAKITPVQRASLACQVSKIVFGASSSSGTNKVPQYLDSSSQQYINRTEINWSNTCDLESRCILSPISAKGVSTAMLIISFFGTKFATRSGGHSTNVGFANINGYGVLIDVVNLNQLTYNKKTVSFGSGKRWGEVYNELNNTGVIAIGGRSPEVGVGGLLVGGGMPYFSSLRGIVSDGVQEYEIVLANSSLTTASSQRNPDLFRALKGGGSNFGILTKISVDAIPADQNIWFEARSYTPEQTPALFPALVKYQAAAENDINANLIFSVTNEATIVGFVYFKPTPRPAVYSSFYNLPFNVSFINSTIGSNQALVEAFSSVGGTVDARYNTCSATLKPNVAAYQQSYSKWLSISSKAAKDYNAMMTYGVQPFTSQAARHGDTRGGNALGLDKVSQAWFAGTVIWQNERDDAAAQESLLAACAAVRDAAASNKVLLPFLFMNDANYAQNVLASYGSASLAFLKAVAKKYDPSGVFQTQQNGGFLVSKS
ncbi:MAG: hypothetical protein LQ342_006550 [Letrouitia transgressa]|nr:MAG: hypothetical protein LQ342_006550 [Letrouitia transgressa]